MTIMNKIFDGLSYSPNIGANDIIGWCLAFLGGFIVFKIIDDFQTRISRHAMIYEIENLISNLFSSDLALKENVDGIQKPAYLRTILDDFTPWIKFDRENDKAKIVDKQRYVKIRQIDADNSTDYISTKAIHELMMLFRRIEKLYKDGIIKKIDLADIWREILPFGVSGRQEFFSTYLLPSDIESMLYVISITLCSCKKYKNNDAINYFHDTITDLSNVKNLSANKRYRLSDKFELWRYKALKK